jgi:uncharacterized 2Fe-2S/4Fe-4S cluster protein (DUF4445 family)
VKVTFQPMGVTYEVPYGETLFEAAVKVGVDVDTVCGGNGSCGKCKVRFEVDPVPPKPIDYSHLNGSEILQGYRLSCQVEALRDMVVYVPPAGSRTKVQILHQGIDREIELQPNIMKIFLPYTPPRQRSGTADWEFFKQALPAWAKRLHVPLHWLKKLPEIIRDQRGMTVTIAGHKNVVAVEAGDTTAANYGVAVDIGSTSVVAYLIDLNSGAEVCVASGLNRQTAYGDDVIARLSRAQFNRTGLDRMHHMVVEQLNDLLLELIAEARIATGDIEELTVVGNMPMHHFLLGLDSTYLGLSPYAPVTHDSLTVTAGELGLALEPDTPVYVLPNIAGFVGSDTVGMMLAADMHETERITLAVDIGTNGEVVLGSRKRLIACSAPAGPAMEGARIKQGMRAAAGAIDHVTLGPDVEYTVIGEVPPKGICGSALIDITAGLLKTGLLDFSGKLLRKDELGEQVPDALRERIVERASRKDNYFIIARAEDSGAERDIVFCQQDIREFQLAKGAIRAGEMVLQRVMGYSDDDLEEVLLAGAFGNFIDRANARCVNLVPQVPLDRLRCIGNAAGVGAKLALTSNRQRLAAQRIAEKCEHIQLSGLNDFQKAFTHAMRFPKAMFDD